MNAVAQQAVDQGIAEKLHRLADQVERDIERLTLMQIAMRRLAAFHAVGGAGAFELAGRFTYLATRQSFEALPEPVLRQLAGEGERT